MGERDRDKSVERLLRQSMSRSSTSPTAACLDGETIAAWAERTLRGAEADHVERHLSECARCAALLATFVRAMPEVGARESLWHRYHLRVFLPVATAATAVMIWFAIPADKRLPERSQPAAQPESNLEAPATPQSVRPFSPTVGASEPVGELAKKQVGLSDSRARSQESTERLAQRAQALNRDTSAAAIAKQEAPPSLADTAPPQAAAGTAEADRRNEARKPATGAAETTAPSAASIARETATLQTLNARQFVAAVEISSPNTSNRWRITTGRLVEYSTNNGIRWQAASLPPSEPLTAGFSPASSVCWLVGRAGAVLVTADGLRFVRVPFPEAVDLVSVRAIDDRTATVTTADGRAFRTTDGGTTWNRP